MLYNKQKDMISELEAEIKALRRKLRDAEATIEAQKVKIDKLIDNDTWMKGGTNEDNSKEAQFYVGKASINKLEVEQGPSQSKLGQRTKDLFISANDELSTIENTAQIILQQVGINELCSMWLGAGGTSDEQPSASIFYIKNQARLKPYLNGAKNQTKISILRYLIDEILLEQVPNVLPEFANQEAERRKREEEQQRKQNEAERQKRKLELDRKKVELKGKLKEKQRKRDEEERKRNDKERKCELHRKRQEETDWQNFKRTLELMLREHSVAFIRNMRAAHQKDDYGAVIKDMREVEIERFLRSINLIQRANKHGLNKTIQYVNRWYAEQKLAFEQSDTVPENGHDFEHWVAAKLNDAGWTATVTQASGDDGVDVIAERDGISVAVQCKRFKGSVGNKAVQEVYSGMKHMQLDRAVVISTGKYTKAAENLASTTGVLLLSEHDIPHMWDLLQK